MEDITKLKNGASNFDSESMIDEIKEYINSIAENPNSVFDNLYTQLQKIKKEDFLKSCEVWENMLKNLKEADIEYISPIAINKIKRRTERTFENCYETLLIRFDIQLKAIEYYKCDIQKARQMIADKAAEWYAPPKEIKRKAGKKPDTIFFLLDKVTQKTFEITKSGHYPIGVENENDKKAGKEINVFLDIDFSEIENNPAFKISNPLTPYDKRIYNIICSLWKAGNQCITLAQIYREMEQKTGLPAKSQAEKIRESAEKMARIVIEIDNHEEAATYRYSHFHSGRINLLPSESITDKSIEINGKILDYCLYLYREPPLLTYAEAHKQITAFTPQQATLPNGLSTTEDNLLLDDYLKYRIARHKTYGTKILYKTIYEMCKIDNNLKRSRATIKIRKLLTHYQQTGMIKSYQEKKDGIIFAPFAALK